MGVSKNRGSRTNKSNVVHATQIDTQLLENYWSFYDNDPTIAACRRMINGILEAGEVEVVGDEGRIEVSTKFQRFIQYHYRELIGPACDSLRVCGYIPYVIRKTRDGVNYVPIVPAPNAVQTAIEMDDNFHRRLVMRSQFVTGSNSDEIENSHYFVSTMPTLSGRPISMLVSLMTPMIRVDALQAAAVEDQLNKARPVMVTQERRGNVNKSSDSSAAALQDLNLFLSDGAGSVLDERVRTADEGRLRQLAEQVKAARAVNASNKNENGMHAAIGDTRPSVDGAQLKSGFLVLPKDQELAPMPTPNTTQEVIAHRFQLQQQICSIMGVPSALMDPSGSAYKAEELVSRSVNAELARLETLLSRFFTQAYAKIYGEKSMDGRKRRRGGNVNAMHEEGATALGTSAEYGGNFDYEATAEVRLRINYTRLVSTDALTQIIDRDVFTREYTGKLVATAMGVYDQGETERNVVTQKEIERRERLARTTQKAAVQPQTNQNAETGRPPVIPKKQKTNKKSSEKSSDDDDDDKTQK